MVGLLALFFCFLRPAGPNCTVDKKGKIRDMTESVLPFSYKMVILGLLLTPGPPVGGLGTGRPKGGICCPAAEFSRGRMYLRAWSFTKVVNDRSCQFDPESGHSV